MSIQTVFDDVRSGRITFGPHLIQRMWENGISIDQVIDTILTGKINKREKDEHSYGRFTKYTLSKSNIMIVVKDCRPGFIVTANRR